jgi:hypothetical protein
MCSSDNSSSEMTEEQVSALLRENQKLRAELERVNRERIEYLQNVSYQFAIYEVLTTDLNALRHQRST